MEKHVKSILLKNDTIYGIIVMTGEIYEYT